MRHKFCQRIASPRWRYKMQDASVAHAMAMATNCELSLARVLDEASMGGAAFLLPFLPLQQQHQHRLLPFVAVACKHIKLNYCRWAQRLAAVSFAGTQQLQHPSNSLCLPQCALAFRLLSS